MKKCSIALITLLFIAAFITTSYAESIEEAKATFKEARKAYISAKKKLSDAQIESFLTFGKAEKSEAIKAIWMSRRELKAAKKVYKEALHVLYEAERARDAKIDRSPWR